jgi:competence protein ComEC
VLLLLSFGAGLMTGLLRFPVPAWALLICWATLWVAHRRATLWVALTSSAHLWVAVVGIGRLFAVVALHDAASSCAAVLREGKVRLAVHLTEPILPDARQGMVRLTEQRCHGELSAKWPAGLTLVAGTEARVDGRWLPRTDRPGRADGLLLVGSHAVTGAAPTVPERLRTWLARTIRQLYGSRAGTVDALVVNRRGAMPAELRDRYGRAGLVHILSISGFHVGVIVGWIVLLGRSAGMPGTRAGTVAAGVAGIYVLFLGWPAPAARAALLAGIAALLHLRQRHVRPLPLLAFTCLLVLLVDPWAILEPGAWLSGLALTGAIVATTWSDQALGASWLWRTLAGSVGATLATAPVTAAMFGMVSLAGLGLNFLAIPLAAMAVPGLLLSLLIAPVLAPLSAALASGSGALLGLLDALAWWGGQWDGLTVIVPAEPEAGMPWIGLLLVAWWGIQGGADRWEALRRWSLAAAAGAWLALGADGWRRVTDRPVGLTVYFLDVGQGDAAAVRTPAGHWILIDGGPVGDGWDAGRRVVRPFLQQHRVRRLAFAALSHAHVDHLGGLATVLEEVDADRVLDPGMLSADGLYGGFLAELDAREIPWQAADSGLTFALDSVRFTVLHPRPGWSQWQEDLNENSLVLLLEYQGFRLLFMGDAGIPAEIELAGEVGPVDLLKVGHHGSRWATGDAWLEEIRPRVAVISLGRRNRYGHPHRETLDRLQQHGVPAWRTDVEGTVTVQVSGGVASVSGNRGHLVLEPRAVP